MRTLIAALTLAVLAACSTVQDPADPASDAPEARLVGNNEFVDAPSYQEALKSWRDAGAVNAWIGARFQYDMSRAMLLSETQRQKNGRMPILKPEEFFAAPRGVCVDLSRFAVETLRSIAPGSKPAYVMIEFDPVSIGGNTLRRHWVVSFEHAGKRFYFADSKRPGHIAGPYASTQEFMADYARYRGRTIVSFREMESYERKVRTLSAKRLREERP